MLKIAILGFGTVGQGVYRTIVNNHALIARRTGVQLEVTHILDREVEAKQHLIEGKTQLVDDISLIEENLPDVVVEVIGGTTTSYDFIRHFLEAGCHVVTANKDLLALKIDELSQIANDNEVRLMYEASVGGGIPSIIGVQTGLVGNAFLSVEGILNGTSNYILTKMTFEGADYEEALADAQAKGYAESDPTADVGGLDAQRKLTILARLAYDARFDLDQVGVEGIQAVQAADIEIAKELGYVVKLVAQAYPINGAYYAAVKPMMVAQSHPFSAIHYAVNAVNVVGNSVGDVTLEGPGAGSLETGSAIVSDIVQIGLSPHIANYIPVDKAETVTVATEDQYYVRYHNTQAEVEAAFDAMGQDFDLLVESDHGVSVVTALMGARALEGLAADLDQVAAYRILKGGGAND